jgi:WD40 repeat protein
MRHDSNPQAGGVWGVTALDWASLDHPVIVTSSLDGTARVWDRRDPGRELAHLTLFGAGYSVCGS